MIKLDEGNIKCYIIEKKECGNVNATSKYVHGKPFFDCITR